jgi:hypothetical protein
MQAIDFTKSFDQHYCPLVAISTLDVKINQRFQPFRHRISCGRLGIGWLIYHAAPSPSPAISNDARNRSISHAASHGCSWHQITKSRLGNLDFAISGAGLPNSSTRVSTVVEFCFG